MAAENKVSQRDMALLNILERVADQLTQQDKRIEEIANSLQEIYSSQDERIGEIIKQQTETSSMVEKNAFRSNTWQHETGPLLEKLNQDFQRYRSDMLGIVNEQDRIITEIREMTKRQSMLAGAQESTDRHVYNLDERTKAQEKPAREHYEYAVRQVEMLSRLIADANRNVERLHMGTEKRLGENNQEELRKIEELRIETTRLHMGSDKRLGEAQTESLHKMEELRIETMRRLLALDGIESALDVLLVRTEPPEKKPFWIKRVLHAIALLFRRIGRRFTKDFEQ